MNTYQENPNNSELVDLIESALATVNRGLLMADDISVGNGSYELVTSPINVGFLAQGDTLSTLLDYTNQNPENYTSSAPNIFINALLAFNYAHQHSCAGALLVDLELANSNKPYYDGYLNVGVINEALKLSCELELLLKSIKQALIKRGFKCQ